MRDIKLTPAECQEWLERHIFPRIEERVLMMAQKKVIDYHVMPSNEKGMHECLEGGQCRCEPRCAVQGDSFRLFVHNCHIVKVPPKPKGLLGPGA